MLIKIFLWRAARELLPTSQNLWKKVLQSRVRFLEQQLKAFHMLSWNAKLLKKIGRTMFADDIQWLAKQDMLSVLQDLAKKGSREEQELMITISAGVFGIQAIVLSLKTRKKIPRS